ncbi:MAG: hypothetical protein PF638_13430 [Candidatus Delongbacteria bacterium]|jgi:multimeric flavodoxin WrbA|nr:hypothetical protein [Candidatus Delongbacteria bacterium]
MNIHIVFHSIHRRGYPYGAFMIAGGMNDCEISEEEIKIARLQGKHVAKITKALCLRMKRL